MGIYVDGYSLKGWYWGERLRWPFVDVDVGYTANHLEAVCQKDRF